LFVKELSAVTPAIKIDDEVLALLKSHAEPFVDSPNTVLRRLLGLASTNGDVNDEFLVAEELTTPLPQKTRRRKRTRRAGAKRAAPGTILPDEEYEVPILKILDAHGGRAPTREVLDELGEMLADRLMPTDHEKLASGDIRWRNRGQFVRLHLIDRGDMVKGSPRGLWEITDQGRDRLVAE
jgi:hypothetical protein